MLFIILILSCPCLLNNYQSSSGSLFLLFVWIWFLQWWQFYDSSWKMMRIDINNTLICSFIRVPVNILKYYHFRQFVILKVSWISTIFVLNLLKWSQIQDGTLGEHIKALPRLEKEESISLILFFLLRITKIVWIQWEAAKKIFFTFFESYDDYPSVNHWKAWAIEAFIRVIIIEK
jgi:hypothetical protein